MPAAGGGGGGGGAGGGAGGRAALVAPADASPHAGGGAAAEDEAETAPLVGGAGGAFARPRLSRMTAEIRASFKLARGAGAAAARAAEAGGGGACGACRLWLARLVSSDGFRLGIMGLILLNTAVMMCERHPMPTTERRLLERLNLAFFGAYVAELLLKLSALGLRAYLADAFNRFDALVVLLSSAEVLAHALALELGTHAQVARAPARPRRRGLSRSLSPRPLAQPLP